MDLSRCDGFDWDRGNFQKNWLKHDVSPFECEQVFFNTSLMIEIDLVHSRGEERYFVLGKTNMNRTLVVIFTLRKARVRIITARDASKKERRSHET